MGLVCPYPGIWGSTAMGVAPKENKPSSGLCAKRRMILTTRTYHVEGGIALSCKATPVCNGKRFGEACHAGKKMILPCVYGPFGGICAIDV